MITNYRSPLPFIIFIVCLYEAFFIFVLVGALGPHVFGKHESNLPLGLTLAIAPVAAFVIGLALEVIEDARRTLPERGRGLH